MKITYQKPEIVELTGMDALGNCSVGSGDSGTCEFDGNHADGVCIAHGYTAGSRCETGNNV